MNFQELEPDFPDPSIREKCTCCKKRGHPLPDWNRLSCFWVQSLYCSALGDCAKSFEAAFACRCQFSKQFFFFPRLKKKKKEQILPPYSPSLFLAVAVRLGNCLFYDVLFRFPSFSLAWLFNFFSLLDPNQGALSELVQELCHYRWWRFTMLCYAGVLHGVLYVITHSVCPLLKFFNSYVKTKDE